MPEPKQENPTDLELEQPLNDSELNDLLFGTEKADGNGDEPTPPETTDEDGAKGNDEDENKASGQDQNLPDGDEPVLDQIDDDLIAKYPDLATFKGKSLNELLKAFGEQRKLIGNQGNQIGELRMIANKINQLEEQIKVKAGGEPKEPTDIDEQMIDDMPDPLTDPDGYVKSLTTMVVNKVGKLIDERLKPVDDFSKAKAQDDTLREVAAVLPKGADVKSALKGWGEANAAWAIKDGRLSPDAVELVTKHPQRFILSVKQNYEHQALVQQMKKIAAGGKFSAAELAKEAIAKANADNLKRSSNVGRETKVGGNKGLNGKEKLFAEILELLPENTEEKEK